MRMAALSLTVRLILVRVTIAGARGRRIALIVEHHIVRRRWTLGEATSLTFQFQVESSLRITTSNFMRRSWPRETGWTLTARSASTHLIVVHHVSGGSSGMHCMGRWMRMTRLRIVEILITMFAHFGWGDGTFGAGHWLEHSLECWCVYKR